MSEGKTAELKVETLSVSFPKGPLCVASLSPTELLSPQLAVDMEKVPLSASASDVEMGAVLSASALSLRRKSLLSSSKERLPVTLRWSDLDYSVLVSDPSASQMCGKGKVSKRILHSMSGSVKVGELCAVMGPSGSGKTTLINVLAARVADTSGSQLSGRITVNGIDLAKIGSKYARISAFVQQDDALFNMQTVRETLLTAAKLRMPSDKTDDERQQRVDAVISELDLCNCANTAIGDTERRGISGGERKRTNVGVELIQDPSLIFLDEPTSGLDSFQALNVVETLKLLCESGCTVIASIHQPRSSIYALFDRLIVLCQGQVAYNGVANMAAVDYFARLGHQCPAYFNPADFFLDVVSIDSRTPKMEKDSSDRIERILEEARKQQSIESSKSGFMESDERTVQLMANIRETSTVQSATSTQLMELSKRNMRQITRDRFTLGIRSFMSVFFACFLSAIYSNTDYSQKSIQNRTGILFFIAINQSFGPMAAVTGKFPMEKAIILRERQAKSYHLLSYYSTKFMTSMPVDIVFPVIFSAVLYWSVNLNSGIDRFFLFIGILIVQTLAALAMGFMASAMAPSVEAANAMAPILMVISILFGGFYINSSNVPPWLAWLENLSIIAWGYKALVINEFKGAQFRCGNSADACIRTGDEVIERLSFDGMSVWTPIWANCLVALGFHCVAFWRLRKAKPKYKKVSSKKE